MENQTATFGSGCFWCTEAVYQMVDGVNKVVSGYMGGHVADPTYQAVCTGETGHAEVIQVTFDAETVSYAELVNLFFRSHDPTTLNRQGHDVGTQYRSVIYSHSEEQRETAEKVKAEVDSSGAFSSPVVTTIEPAEVFYPAEDYHQNFYELNKTHPYCTNVIRPKISKLA